MQTSPDAPDPAARRESAHLRRREKHNKLGGGFIVARRGDRRGDLRTAHPLPIEHDTFASALAEATRLALQHNRRFVVMQEIASADPAPAADTAEAA